MIVDNGKTSACQALRDKLTTGGLGSNSTTPTSSDTGLNGGANLYSTGTNKTLVGTAYDSSVSHSYLLDYSSGNGVTYYEFGLNDGTLLFNRVTFPAWTKTSDVQFDIVTLTRVI